MKRGLFILFLFVSTNSFSQETITDDDRIYIYHSVKEASAHPEKVFRLKMSRAKLDSFPTEIFKFTNLEELDLSRNKIEFIPAEIGTLINLKRLNLANNKLVHLPPEIGNLKRLEYLGLNRNVLEDLPPTIGNLQNLEVLELWDNELDNIPEEISQLNNLQILELRGILLSDEEQQRIDSLVVKSAKIHMSPSCDCKN